MNNYLINVSFPTITAKGHILNKFDYEVIDDMYNKFDDNGYPIVYNFLYKYILQLEKNNIVVTFSPDPAVSSSTISGFAERPQYMYCIPKKDNTISYLSKLKILYITGTPHLLTNYCDITVENLTNSIISNLLCLNERISYTGHKLKLNSDQFFVIGLNENLIENDQNEMLHNLGITNFTLKQLRKKGISNVIKSINEIICDDPIFVVFDMSVTSYEIAPCVNRFIKDGMHNINLKHLNGLNVVELKELFLNVNKTNLVGMDITGYDFRIDSKELAYRITAETAKIPLTILLDFKEKKINIFNEDSRFIIYRPIEQEDENDVGWFILKGMSLGMREELMKDIDSDTITTMTIELDGEDQSVLISTTTMTEQESKTYFDIEIKITDCVLYPAQKAQMMFELLNTPENCLHT